MSLVMLKQPGAYRWTARLAALLISLCACLSVAHAKGHKPPGSGVVKVIASMPFTDKPAADMQIKQASGKSYLYVQLAIAQGVVVVDVTNPKKPRAIASLPASAGASLKINGDAALVTVDEPRPEPPQSELVLWDISDPANPRMVQSFSGVLRVLRDERNYTYVLNQQGLWIVFDNPAQPQNTSDYGG